MKTLLRWFACLVLLPSMLSAAERPNIVVFLADDLGQRDLGCYGSTFYDTPNLDRLAREGMKFTQAYAACPVCSPTRAALLTGRWPQRTRVTDYIGAAQPERWTRNTKLLPAPYATQLALEETTLAEVLKGAGYATMHAGKWHLGGERFFPEHQGFDVNKGGLDRGGPYGGRKYFSPYENPRLEDGPDGEHIADRLAAECGKFIESNKDRPFFVSYWLYDVHTPLMGKPELVKKYEERRKKAGEEKWGDEGERKARLTQAHAVYGAMVETMDGAVGAVLAKLDALGLREKTLVIFASDNGGLSTSEGSPTSNHPLRGGKGWLYEGGVRVPLIARWSGKIRPGTISDRVVSTPDIFSTVVEACGLAPVPSARDGVSFLPALRSERQPERGPIFWHYPHYGNQGGFPGGAVRDGDWKLIERYESGQLELYNLASDPSETRDLAAKEPSRAKSLHAQLAAWRTEVGAVMPTTNPKFTPAATNPPSRTAASRPWSFTPDPALPNVLILGDSISIGYTLDVRELLKGKANVFRPLTADGKNAENCSGTTKGVKSIDRWLGDRKWDVIHFNFGLHDLKHVAEPGDDTATSRPLDPRQASVRQYQENLEIIVKKLKATGARLIFATTTPVAPGTTNPLREPEEPPRYNAAAVEIMNANGIAVNDLFAFCEPRLEKIQLPKNVHFTADGYRALAEQVTAVIERELAAAKAAR